MTCPRCGSRGPLAGPLCGPCVAARAGGAPGSGEPPAAPRPAAELVSPGRMGWAVVTLAGLGVLDAAAAMLALAARGQDDDGASAQMYGAAARCVLLAARLGSLGALLAAVPFLRWMTAALQDVNRIRPGHAVRFRESGPVAGFLIPLLNLYMPLIVLRALRRASDPGLFPPAPWERTRRRVGYRDQPVGLVAPRPLPSAPVGAWYAAYLASVLTSVLLRRQIFGAFRPGMAAEPGAMALALGLQALAALLLAAVVRGIDARLTEQHRRALSAAAGTPSGPLPDRRSTGVEAGAVAALVTFAACAEMHAIGSSATRYLRFSSLGVGLLAFALVLGAAALARWRRPGRPAAAAAAAIGCALALVLPSAAYVRVAFARVVRCADQAHVAFEEQEELLRRVGDPLMDGAALARALDARLAELERAADEGPSAPTSAWRCEGRRRGALAHARLACADAREAIGPASLDAAASPASAARRAEAFGRLADAAREVAGVLGERGGAAMAHCLRSGGVVEGAADEVAQRWDSPEGSRLAATQEAIAALAASRVAQLRFVAAHPGAFRAEEGEPELVGAGLSERWDSIERDILQARRNEARASRLESGRGRVSAKSSLFEARAGFATRAALSPRSPDAPPRPPRGLVESRYAGPLGSMLAYATPPPPDAQLRPAVLWVPGRGDLEADLAAASELAAEGAVVLLPTVRGEYKNPGSGELDYGEISDLAAARDHLSALRHVDSRRILLAGVGDGATRVLLLSEAVSAYRGAVGFEASLDPPWLLAHKPSASDPEIELRSPVSFAPFIKSPTYVASALDRRVLAGDEMEDLAGKKSAPLHSLVCPKGRCDAATLVRVLKRKLGETGPFSLRQQDLDDAVRPAVDCP